MIKGCFDLTKTKCTLSSLCLVCQWGTNIEVSFFLYSYLSWILYLFYFLSIYVVCEAGFREVQGTCVLCSRGEYQPDEVNIGSCTSCLDGKTTEFLGSTMESECSKILDLCSLTLNFSYYPVWFLYKHGNNSKRKLQFLKMSVHSQLLLANYIKSYLTPFLINKFYVKSKCIEVYEGFHTSV